MNRTQRHFFVAILLFALLLRIGFAVQWHSRAAADGVDFRLGDSHSYWTLAQQVAQGKPYQYGSEQASAFRAPLYPIFLSPFTLIANQGHGILAARLAGCLLGTVAVGLLMTLATRIGGVCSGLAGGFLLSIYPSAVGMSVLVLSEALFIPLMLLHLLVWQSAWETTDGRRQALQAIAVGGIAAAAVLTRPSWLLFLPFSMALGLLLPHQRLRHVKLFAWAMLGFVTLMTPWWIRNYSVTDRFVPTTLQVGPSLYDGLHEGATGASDEGMAFVQEIVAAQIAEDSEALTPPASTLEYRVNQRATRMAVQWASSHPVKVVQLAVAKFVRTWSLWPDGGDINSPAMRIAITFSCFVVLGLASTATLLAIRPFTWQAGICWVPCIYFTLLHMVFVGSIRYREPAMVVLTSLAGCAVAWLAGCRTDQQCPTLITEIQRKHGSASDSQETAVRPNCD